MKVLYVVPYDFIPPDSGNKNLLYSLLKGVSPLLECDVAMLMGGEAEEIKERVRKEFPRIRDVAVFDRPIGLRRKKERILSGIRGFHPALGSYRSTELERWIRARSENGKYDIIHFDMVHTAPYRKACGVQATLLVASDAYSLAARGGRILSRSWVERIRFGIEEWLHRNYEKKNYHFFDMVCTVSDRDRSYLEALVPLGCFRTIGVGLAPEYGTTPIRHLVPSAVAGKRILCTGSLSAQQVADGVVDFLRNVFPAVRRRHPDATVTVLGKNPCAILAVCIRETEGVEHVDYVEDYAAFLDQDWTYVHPQRCGTGLQTKVQQAMALGLPVVAFNVSFGGLGVEDGVHCLISRDLDDMTSKIIALVGSPESRWMIGSSASSFVREKFSIRRVGEEMICIYEEILRQRTGKGVGRR